MKKATYIPFDGFYESAHSAIIDRHHIDMFQSDCGGCFHGELYEQTLDSVRYGSLTHAYARAYTEAYFDAMEIESGTYGTLISPRFYNYETDRIMCTIEISELRRILRELPSEDLREKAREMFSDGPGFISYYDPDVTALGDLEAWDENQIYCLLCALDTPEPWDLMESVICNGGIESMIMDAADDDFIRAVNVSDYLSRRAERGRGYEKTQAKFEVMPI